MNTAENEKEEPGGKEAELRERVVEARRRLGEIERAYEALKQARRV